MHGTAKLMTTLTQTSTQIVLFAGELSLLILMQYGTVGVRLWSGDLGASVAQDKPIGQDSTTTG